ncbi:hypothetical protein [Gordonia paraffinivorans]|uniref:hypothetical protein n=1 Tax=Gordonia paraffinivorans TaxID=175628 RepID=UPI001446ACFB|nr:hypothetical protein [Gordonia paraffinivorans]
MDKAMNGDLFDFGSAYVRRALVGFAAVYVVVTIGTCAHITSPLRWAGLLSAFVVLVLIALRLQAAPCGLWCAWLLTACVVAAVALAWWSLPTDGYGVLQSGPATVGGVVAFTLLMVRGHPVVAWCGALTMSAVCVVWSVSRGDGVSAGLNTTLPAYPVLILTLLSLGMLRPMLSRIVELRAEVLRAEAEKAATKAAADERRRHFADFESRARPMLERVAAGDVVTDGDVRRARLLEAQLRDGIRAPGWDRPELRKAVWDARGNGTEIVLLDDGGLDDLPVGERIVRHERITQAVIDELDRGCDRITARILPPGRTELATVVVERDGITERLDFDHAGGVDPEAGETSGGSGVSG